jgi:hypothetical protein
MIDLYFLFIVLALLASIEASTSISRKVGYILKTPESGFIFQSSLALISRALVFMFMPALGYMSDTGTIEYSLMELLSMYILIPFFLLMTFLFRNKIEIIYAKYVMRIKLFGSLFKGKIKINYRTKNIKIINIKSKFYKLYAIVIIAYIPYYISWTVIIMLLGEYQDNRGLILGLSSILTGINTIILTVFIDPQLGKLGKYKYTINRIYEDMIFLRFISSVLGIIFILMVYYIL